MTFFKQEEVPLEWGFLPEKGFYSKKYKSRRSNVLP